MQRLATLLACLTLLLISGCAASSPAPIECAGLNPILVSPQDHLTPETERQILALDLQLKAVCR